MKKRLAAGLMGTVVGLGLVACKEQVKKPVDPKAVNEEVPVASSDAGGETDETIDEAIARGDLAEVRRLIAADPGKVQRGKNPGMSPLLQAVLRNKGEIVLVLLEAGADPNERDRSGRTALHLAVERGNAGLIPELIKHQADPNLLDQIGWTPLHWAAAKDKVEVAKALLDGGADLTVLSERGGTALHEGAASGGEEMIMLLLEGGVDPAVVSETGVTALDVAREMNNEAAIKVLGAL